MLWASTVKFIFYVENKSITFIQLGSEELKNSINKDIKIIPDITQLSFFMHNALPCFPFEGGAWNEPLNTRITYSCKIFNIAPFSTINVSLGSTSIVKQEPICPALKIQGGVPLGIKTLVLIFGMPQFQLAATFQSEFTVPVQTLVFPLHSIQSTDNSYTPLSVTSLPFMKM